MKKLLDNFIIMVIIMVMWACLSGGLQCFILFGFPTLTTCLSLLVIKITSVAIVSLIMLYVVWRIKNEK